MHSRADDQHCVEATVQASVESCGGLESKKERLLKPTVVSEVKAKLCLGL